MILACLDEISTRPNRANFTLRLHGNFEYYPEILSGILSSKTFVLALGVQKRDPVVQFHPSLPG